MRRRRWIASGPAPEAAATCAPGLVEPRSALHAAQADVEGRATCSPVAALPQARRLP